eukprot:scaffold33890_cov88-Skeletonema_marinoi.AAC.1
MSTLQLLYQSGNNSIALCRTESIARVLPNPLPLQSIHRSSSSPKIQRRLAGKSAAAALIMIGLAFIGGATYGGGSSNKEILILGQPEYSLHCSI